MTTTIYTSALFQTNTTILVSKKSILLVDPNWLPHEIAAIRAEVDEYLDNRNLYLLFTHSDYDHIIGYGAFPEATIIASHAFVNNPDKEKILEEIHQFDESFYITRDYHIAYPPVHHIIEQDGETLTLDDLELTCYLAPGHNADGMFTIVENNGLWIAGDYLSDIEFPFIYHNSSDYLNTLEKVDKILANHTIKKLIPGHGHATTSTKEIQKRQLENKKYILELKSAARTAKAFDLKGLWERYEFRRGMQTFHQKNIALIEKEIKTNSVLP